ncbi:DUF805 domain-containing protein [Blastococcus saxobsidens]|uniref:DUF805 domain-containing protein n=1 Tax=Blastococcus saxobsidens TaxID=138336 RepID=A0A6L9W5K2_9ACTN|nr:DUF805 domain-containing protein [Blastococcus saxobsidens]
MTLAQWYVARGRITRRTWWLHYVAVVVTLGALAAVVDTALGHPGFLVPEEPTGFLDWYGGPVGSLVAFLTLVPSVTSTVARLHDRGYSAWPLLWLLLPVVGWIVLLIQVGFLPGHPVPNRYGPTPVRDSAEPHVDR